MEIIWKDRRYGGAEANVAGGFIKLVVHRPILAKGQDEYYEVFINQLKMKRVFNDVNVAKSIAEVALATKMRQALKELGIVVGETA